MAQVPHTQPQVGLLVAGGLFMGFWFFGAMVDGPDKGAWMASGTIALFVGGAMVGMRYVDAAWRVVLSVAVGVGVAFAIMATMAEGLFEAFFPILFATLGTVLLVSGLPRPYAQPVQ